MADETDYSASTWSYLAGRAETGLRGQGAVVEAMRRVVVAMEASEKSANILGARVERLNRWLLWLTVAMFVLTVVQAVAAIVQGWAAWRALATYPASPLWGI